MKKFVLAALCGLALVAVSNERAAAEGGRNFCINFGGCGIGFWRGSSAYVGCGDCCGCPTLGPWYMYFPYEAHFQTPAPTGYPFGPGPMTAGCYSGGYGGGAGYPCYWYGH